MAKLLGLVIGKIINLILMIITLPFALIYGLYSGLSKVKNIEQNSQNGADIRALCTEMGVPDKAYNQIVVNQMDEVKTVATYIGQPGGTHHNTPWNNRIAVVINSMHQRRNDELIYPETLENSLIKEINEKINSQELARITAWMIYCNFDNSSMDRSTQPESVKTFINKCTGGYTLFDQEYDNQLEKTIRIEFYIDNKEYTDALDLFSQKMSTIQDEHIKNKLGYSVLQQLIVHWEL